MTSLLTLLKRLNVSFTIWNLPSSKSLSKEKQLELKQKVLAAIDSEDYHSLIQEVLLTIEMANKAFLGYITKEQKISLSTPNGEVISTFDSGGYFLPMGDKDGDALVSLDKRKTFRPFSTNIVLSSTEGPVPANTIFECSSNRQVGPEFEWIYIKSYVPTGYPASIVFSRDVVIYL